MAAESSPQTQTPLPKTEAEKLIRSKRWFYDVAACLGAIALIYVLGFVLEVLATPVSIVIWTVVIVFCLRGIVSFFEKKGLSRFLGTVIAYVIMVVVIGLILVLMCSPAFGIGEQFTNLAQSIPGYIQQVIEWWSGVSVQYQDILNNEMLQQYAGNALQAVSQGAQEAATNAAAGVFAVGGSIANAVLAIGFALVVAFWILMELPNLGKEFKRLVGPSRQDDLEMLHVTLTSVLGGYIRATIVQCAIIGFVCAILFLIAGVPNFAAIGVITGILNIIPVVGPWFGGGLAAIAGLLHDPITSLIALVGTIVIQQFVYTFISPKLMESSVDVHPALTIICLMAGSAIGATMAGLGGSIVGMLASIPAVAVAKALFVYYFEKRTGRELVSEDGVFFKGTPSEGEGVDPISDATSPLPGTTAKLPIITREKLENRFQTGKMKAVNNKEESPQGAEGAEGQSGPKHHKE